MEYIDILNEKGEPTGEKKTRSDVHKYGYWHRVILILLINSKEEILLQKRAANKEKNPNLWDLSCAGHLSSGDSSILGAMRELEEELGIKPNEQNMQLVATIRNSYQPKEGFNENELQDIYLYRTDVEIKNIKMQEEEVSEVRFMPFEMYATEILNNNKKFVNRKKVIEIVKRSLNP